MKNILYILVILVSAIGAAKADHWQNAKISYVQINDDGDSTSKGIVTVQMEMDMSGTKPSCHTSSNKKRFYIDLNRDSGQYLFSTALTANTTNRAVDINLFMDKCEPSNIAILRTIRLSPL